MWKTESETCYAVSIINFEQVHVGVRSHYTEVV